MLMKTNRYLNECRQGMDPPAWQQQVNGQYEHYLEMIGTVHIADGDAATAITNAINDGVWTAAQKTTLNQAVGDRLAADQHVQPSGRRCVNRPGQKIPLFKNYLSGDDVKVLKGTADDVIKLNRIASRMASLRIDIPMESEWRKIIQQCQAFGFMTGQTDNASYFKAMIDQLKGAVRSRFRK